MDKLKPEFSKIKAEIYAKNKDALIKKVSETMQEKINEKIKQPMRDETESKFNLSQLNAEAIDSQRP